MYLSYRSKNAGGIVSDVSTKYLLQIWSGAQAAMKLRPDFMAGPPAARLFFLSETNPHCGKVTKKNPQIFLMEIHQSIKIGFIILARLTSVFILVVQIIPSS